MLFTEKLRLLMRRHGLTQTSLGVHMDVSQRAVGKWLAGDSAPGPEVAKRLADFLRIPIDDFLDDTRDLPPDPEEVALRERHAKARAAAEALPTDRLEEQQAVYVSTLKSEHQALAIKDLAKRLRQMADEIDPPKKP